MNVYTVTLDLIILCVLGITIAFCWKLNLKIAELKSARSDMESFIKSLDTAIINAHKSIVNLNDTTEKATNERHKYISEGTELTNDLSFMISSGSRLLQRTKADITKLEELMNTSKITIENIETSILEIDKRRMNMKYRRKKQSIKIQ